MLFTDPLMCDPERGALELQECSPCIGAGSSGCDIGAYHRRCACEQTGEVPSALFLNPANPSPFSTATTLRLDVPPDAGHLTLAIYNVSGQLICTLLDGVPTPGEQQLTWRGDDARGNTVGAGVYFARCESVAGAVTQKLVLLR
jgi:hypothetical protein